MPGSRIRVEIPGLAGFAHVVKAFDQDAASLLRAGFATAGQRVVTRAQAIANSLGGQQKVAAQALSSSAGLQSATIRLREDAAHPFALGAEFGAVHGPSRGVWDPQTPPWNQLPQFKRGGYFMFPAAREQLPLITEAIAAGVEAALAKWGT